MTGSLVGGKVPGAGPVSMTSRNDCCPRGTATRRQAIAGFHPNGPGNELLAGPPMDRWWWCGDQRAVGSDGGGRNGDGGGAPFAGRGLGRRRTPHTDPPLIRLEARPD